MAMSDDKFGSTSTTDDDKPSRSRRRSRRKEDTPNFSFIHFTGEASFRPGRAHKAVRAQAARASSDRRLATIEKRREAKRANSADPTIQLEIVSEEYADDHLSPSSYGTLSPLERARSAPPRIARDEEPSQSLERSPLPTADDWTCDINDIVHKTLQIAYRTMYRLQIPCDTHALSRQFQNPTLYSYPLMIQCLELLATTAIHPQERPAMTRRIVVLLRHKLIIAVQGIIQVEVEAKAVLASIVALLAGWEEEHGEPHACEYHLRALAGLLPNGKGRPTPAEMGPVDVVRLYRPGPPDNMPAGFRFYLSLNLLPGCLVEPVASLGDNQTSTFQARRHALLALACRPKDETRRHDLIYRVCSHIQVAAALLVLSLPSSHQDETARQDCLNAWHAESLTLDTSSLFGTVYDEVLVWSLCIFCGTTKSPPSEQIETLKIALKSNAVQGWDALDALLERYVAPTGLLARLQRNLGSIRV